MFISVLLTMLTSTSFSTWSILLDNSHTAGSVELMIAHSGYLFFHNLTIPMYVLYVISLSDTWHKLKKSPVQQFILTAPMIFLLCLLASNAFTNAVFSVTDHTYKRGELFFLLYIVACLYMGLGLFFLFKNRKVLSIVKIISISSLIPLMLIAIIIQFIFPQYVIELFAGSLSLLIITMTTQRPEELMDARTGLGNYNAYTENMKRSFVTEKKVSVIMINIGNYNAIRSMLVYDDALQFLKIISSTLQKICKTKKVAGEIYYLDRGRFRIILSRKEREEAFKIAEAINELLKENIEINGLHIGIDAHFCITNCPEDVKDFTTLMSFGSNFHERNKNSSNIVLASELFKQDKFDMVNNIDIIIERAIQNKSFKVYYQPIYSVEKGKFSTAEALLRLFDEEYGFVPPDMFIPAAEKSGAIHRIGDFVLEEVCRFIASDKFQNLGLEYIEINLSVAQCMHGDLADKVLKTLEKYNLTSDKINLEITETAVSRAQHILQNNLNKLSEAGVSFSLDDYGTGYSNMKRVVQLPLKIVKLDKSFVDEQNNPKMWIVLQNTVKMLKDMNMEIVVEGIETEKMVEQFTDLNCDYIQGYYYSKPIPEDDFVEFVKKAHSVA
ncbi:MAG: GGDEF domain-containing protein [Ruminiclostridium sp.]|nr:GGDEF domain-containing protein [Ruminiclostridium sp.]